MSIYITRLKAIRNTAREKIQTDLNKSACLLSSGNRRNQIDGCPPAPLEEGQSAVLYLRKFESDGTMMDNMYDIEFAPMSDKNIDDAQKLDDLTLVCGLNRSFPGEQPLPDSK